VKIKEMGVEVIDDLPAMLQRVDAVLLEKLFSVTFDYYFIN
jgi:hypothetical protein